MMKFFIETDKGVFCWKKWAVLVFLIGGNKHCWFSRRFFAGFR